MEVMWWPMTCGQVSMHVHDDIVTNLQYFIKCKISQKLTNRYLNVNVKCCQKIPSRKKFSNLNSLSGRSQLSTFMKAYTAYARGEGVWDHRTLFPRKSTFTFNHWQCIIKYCTCLECGQYAHICRSFMYNNTFEALFLTSKCTKRGFLWTHSGATPRFL